MVAILRKEETPMTQQKRGFAAMNKKARQEAARRGGQASGGNDENISNQ
jgi:general stress protein YciG